MSNIVNVGIQQGGVEDGTPEALSADSHTFVRTFMSEEDQALLDRSYVAVSETELSENGKPYSELYPNAMDTGVFALRTDISSEDRTKLDYTFGLTTWTIINALTQIQSQYDLVDESGKANALPVDVKSNGTGGPSDSADTVGLQNIDLDTLYELQPLLNSLPPAFFVDARNQAAQVDPNMREQSKTMLVAALYRELGVDMTALEIDYILKIGLLMLLITLVSGVATVLVSFFSTRIGAGVARDLRSAVFSRITSFSHGEFDRFSTASLITRSTNDVTQIQMVLTFGIRMICYAPIMGIGGTIMALQKSVSMSWIIGVGVVVLLCIIGTLMVVVLPKFRIMQTLVDRVNLVAREALSGLMVIRAFGRTDFEQQRFDKANSDLTRTTLFVNRAMTFLMPTMMLFMNGLSVLIIWVGAQHVAQSQMQVGDVMAYMQYVMQIITSFMFIAMIFVFVPRAQVSAQRIHEVLETVPAIVDPANPRHIDPESRGIVEFKNVSFRYEGADENALSNISFIARPGQTTAFIGSTGSGKSTIVNLIPRFYDVTAGSVLVGGVDVRELSQHELRGHIGYVPQKNVLLSGTIAENIAYGSLDSSAVNIAKAARIAQATEFIEEKTEGYDFEVAQGGSNVSGGQRQRLSIARALAIEPDIFLFDDSFSALDMKTDAALRRALSSDLADSTLIIVAQRVSTIRNADQIFVIDDGRIVGAGNHEELMRSCQPYYEIASSQLKGEELPSGGTGLAGEN